MTSDRTSDGPFRNSELCQMEILIKQSKYKNSLFNFININFR